MGETHPYPLGGERGGQPGNVGDAAESVEKTAETGQQQANIDTLRDQRRRQRRGDIAEPARLDPGVELGRDVENAHLGEMRMDLLARIRQEMLPFAELLGIEFVSAAPDKIVAEMIVREDLCTRPAVLHGGAVMAFADTLGATGTILNLPEGAGTTTIESKTNFVAPAPAGTRVIGEAIPIHRGRRTMIWQTRVLTPEGRLVALVTQTQLVL